MTNEIRRILSHYLVTAAIDANSWYAIIEHEDRT